MGRKKDPIWDQVEKLNDKVFKCKYCGEEFAGGASRIKAHLSGIEGKGIRRCTRVLKDIQIEASSTFGDSNKTPCRSVNPCNPQQDFVNSSKGKGVLTQSDVPEECILFPELLQMATVPTIHDSIQCIINNVNFDSIEVNCLDSNQSAMGNVNSGDPKENYSTSNQSITRNIHSGDLSKGKSINMGGKKDGFSHNVEPVLKCGVKYRMYDHVDISQTEIMGVDTEKLDVAICSEDPEDVQEAAYDASNKRLKRNIDSIHLEHNFVNLNSHSSLKGNAEFYQMPTSTDFIGWQFRSYINKIWSWLINEEVQVIGVSGMGGVGKSTLLKHIYNKLLEASLHVIWVDVQQGCSVLRLQKAIAELCDVCLIETDGPVKIAAKLLHALKKIKKCIIILDDVWDDIVLESVGIPLTNSDIQVIIASRLFDVCQTMGSKKHILKMETSELVKDCQDLFFKVLGKDESLLSHRIINIAKSIIQECDALPLAIATIARSMRGKDNLREWKYVLENLRNLEKEQHMKKSVFPLLALSYDHLNDKFLQECFVHCAFYLESDEFSCYPEELIIHFVAEGLIDGNKSLEAQLDEGHIILNKLIKNNLLIEDSEENGYIHIHRLVCAWATSIANESAGYMAKRQVSPEHEWKENIRKVKLTVKEIPSSTSPTCPMLSTLILRDNCDLKLIPNSFFINMASLKVLNLSYCRMIERLPTSVSNLESLTTLFLRGCSSLKYVPSLAKLQKLERLELCRTAITELPLGLEMLINLRWLNVAGIKDLTMPHPLVISKLTNLQVLLLGENTITGSVKMEDLVGLKKLECISAYFTNRNEFNACVRRIVNAQNGGTQNCFLQLLRKPHEFDEIWLHSLHLKTISFRGIGNTDDLLLPVDVNMLEIKCCDKWRCLCDVLSFDDKNNSKGCNITECSIYDCRELEGIFCLSSSCSFCSSFQSLEILFLRYLRSLSMLSKETNVATTTPWAPFSYLRDIYVYRCDRMKTLLTPVMTGHLQNLENLTVHDCDAMEEIFLSEKNNESTDIDNDISMMMFPDNQLLEGLLSTGTESNYQEEQVADTVYIDHIHAAKILLPKLKSVHLQYLPRLNTVYEGILACNSLQEFEIHHCPNLKQAPQIQPPFENFEIN